MIRNYIKTAIRNLQRHSGFTLLNVLGLTVGIAVCLLLFAVISFEKSYDNFHADKENIYRIVTNSKRENQENLLSGVPLPVPTALRVDYPELKHVTAIQQIFKMQLGAIDEQGNVTKKFTEEKQVYIADTAFLNVFNFPLLAGDKATVLSAPNTAIITRSMAEKYFGNWQSAIGRHIRAVGSTDQYQITGVLENPPANTDLPLGLVISMATWNHLPYMKDWVSITSQYNCYVALPSGLSPVRFENMLEDFSKKYRPNRTFEHFRTQPLADVHKDERYRNFSRRYFADTNAKVFSLIGLFILLIACVNFINLATAQAVNRSKEVGVRKVLGGSRSQLALQFLGETGIIALMAALLALSLAVFALPYLGNVLQVPVTFKAVGYINIALFLAIVVTGVTVLSGIYPALVLSGFNPITALKSRINRVNVAGISLRRSLVVIQFVIAQVLIIATLVIVKQMNFFSSADMGFNKESVVAVNVPNDSASLAKSEVLKSTLLQQPGIQYASFSHSTPVDFYGWGSEIFFDHSLKETDFSVTLKWADIDYFKTYNLQLVAGRTYIKGDTINEFVVNQTLLKKLGIQQPEQILGKSISMWGNSINGTVVGVVKDFNTESFREEMQPVLMANNKGNYRTLNIRLQARQQLTSTLAAIEAAWKRTYPDYIYSYTFMNDLVADLYKAEQKQTQLYKLAAGIAIFISCLGLYGLVSFMATRKTKEVGIRKVLGASTAHIVYLFSKEFTILVAIAFVIAAPLAWYFMQQWLQGFYFRINMGIGIFLICIVVSLSIAWITMGYRAVKTALINPVKSLRNE